MTAQEKYEEAHEEWENEVEEKLNEMVDEYNQQLEEYEDAVTDSEFDFGDMVKEHGQEFMSEEYPDNELYDFDEDTIDELFSSPFEAMRAAVFGEVNFSDNYFFFNGYGNIETVYDAEDYYRDNIDEDEFKEWCADNGYYEEPDRDDYVDYEQEPTREDAMEYCSDEPKLEDFEDDEEDDDFEKEETEAPEDNKPNDELEQ